MHNKFVSLQTLFNLEWFGTFLLFSGVSIFIVWFSILDAGLDPAFPLYMFINPTSRLSADAADFVDIIHTDGGILGYPWPLGHADFYPNQGIPLQPGCAKQELSKNRWYSILGKLTINVQCTDSRFTSIH